MPVDVIYYECDCGFKGYVPWTSAKKDVTLKLRRFEIELEGTVCKRVCPKCGKEIPKRERPPWICI